MRFFRFEKLSKKFTIESIPIPKRPSEHSVLLKVKGFGINRADLLQKMGRYPPPPGASDILGLEVVGHVESNESLFSKAEQETEQASHSLKNPTTSQLYGTIMGGGGYAEYVWADRRHLIPMGLTEKLCLEEMTAVPEVFLTAWQLLRYGNVFGYLKSLDRPAVLYLPAGASGVGTSLIQIAKALWPHVTVITTVSTPAKAKACLALGADYAVSYKTEGYSRLKELIGEITDGRGVDVVLDCLGPGQADFTLEILKPEGVWVVYSLLAGLQNSNPNFLRSIFLKKVTMINTLLRNRSGEYKAELISSFNTTVMPLVLDGSVRPVVHKVNRIDFADEETAVRNLEELHSIMEQNLNTGKLLAIVE